VVGSLARHLIGKSKWTNVMKMKCNEWGKKTENNKAVEATEFRTGTYDNYLFKFSSCRASIATIEGYENLISKSYIYVKLD
jgi:hypothetical protein